MGIFKRLLNPTWGLIDTNVQVYFRSRAAGDDHWTALLVMIETRYLVIRDDSVRGFLLEELSKMQAGVEDEWAALSSKSGKSGWPCLHDLGRLVRLMHSYEAYPLGHPLPPLGPRMKFLDDLSEVIEKYRRKYPNINLADK